MKSYSKNMQTTCMSYNVSIFGAYVFDFLNSSFLIQIDEKYAVQKTDKLIETITRSPHVMDEVFKTFAPSTDSSLRLIDRYIYILNVKCTPHCIYSNKVWLCAAHEEQYHLV